MLFTGRIRNEPTDETAEIREARARFEAAAQAEADALNAHDGAAIARTRAARNAAADGLVALLER